jgi:hypothetical protein
MGCIVHRIATPVDKYHVPQWLGDKATRRFHVMVKPAGSACNLDCDYCFYLSKQKLAGGPGPGNIHDEVLDAFVRDYIQSVTGDEVVFSWQGGEPTLRGIAFFEKVVALQRKYAKPGQRIENDVDRIECNALRPWLINGHRDVKTSNGPLYCSATFKRNLTGGIYKGD